MAARRHSKNCASPVITIHLSEPRCETCSASPRLEDLRRQQTDGQSFLPIPPDEPPGQLNLHWPPTVHYIRDEDLNPSQPFEEETRQTAAPVSSDHPVYDQALEASEIRLAHLSPSSSEEAPLHLTLETFPDNHFPEYEAVSYAWGGEEGDSTPVLPVYIGQYWDVLLQTRNCHSMLGYLRRQDRLRTLWVDAICLNQQSASEKADQIPRMGFIFRQAMRVVAFLEYPTPRARFSAAREI
jgi:hypothetical protein